MLNLVNFKTRTSVSTDLVMGVFLKYEPINGLFFSLYNDNADSKMKLLFDTRIEHVFVNFERIYKLFDTFHKQNLHNLKLKKKLYLIKIKC